MKQRVIIAAFLFASCAVINTMATSLGAKRLNVRQILDIPAGCLPENEGESIELKSADVSDPDRPGYQWGIELIPGAKPLTLHPGECVAFGRHIEGYQQIGETRSLEEGKSYSFGIRRGDKLNKWVSDIYEGLFCVQRTTDGHLAYLPYVYHPNGTITYPPCGRYAGLPPAPDGINPPRPASSFPVDTSSP